MDAFYLLLPVKCADGSGYPRVVLAHWVSASEADGGDDER
jgi:hypothetical protein